MLKDFRGKLTIPQFLVLDLHLFPRDRPANGWPKPESPQQVDCDDKSWRYVVTACMYLCHGNSLTMAAKHAGHCMRPLSRQRAGQMLHKFVRHNATVLERDYGLSL